MRFDGNGRKAGGITAIRSAKKEKPRIAGLFCWRLQANGSDAKVMQHHRHDGVWFDSRAWIISARCRWCYALYATRLPRATVRTYEGRGHQFGDDLADVAADIIRTSST